MKVVCWPCRDWISVNTDRSNLDEVVEFLMNKHPNGAPTKQSLNQKDEYPRGLEPKHSVTKMED